MGERELTAENVVDLFKPKSRQPDPNEPSPSEPIRGEPIASEPSEPALSADERELMARYQLDAGAVKRVRGDTWEARCADAKRLAERLAEAEPQVNAGEIAALARRQGYDSGRTLVETLHPAPKPEGGEGGES